jgi:hypothetical protein
MGAVPIFFDIPQPNAPMLFYLSALLSVALFFKFSRLLSMRNLDVLTLFLPMPGLLLLIEGGPHNFWGYLWLLFASLYFLIRCLLDLTLVRRPALSSNLDLSGLSWLGGALFVSLVAVAFSPGNQPSPQSEPSYSPAPDKAREIGEKAVGSYASRVLTLVCHLSIAVGLVLIGWRHFDDLQAGMSATTLYLLLPYTYLLLPDTALGISRWDHVWPMALMVWTVFTFRWPFVAGTFLGVAAGSVFSPVVTFPAWLSFYWRRGALRFALAFVLAAGLCLAVIGGMLWLNGELSTSLYAAWTDHAWQPWKPLGPQTYGIWLEPQAKEVSAGNAPSQQIGLQAVYRLPVFIAYLALVVTTFFWPNPKNLAHVLSLSVAVLIGIQFWYADRGGIYVLWYLPFLLLLIFRPNLSACQPATPSTDDWLVRFGRRLGRLFRFRRPAEPGTPEGSQAA